MKESSGQAASAASDAPPIVRETLQSPGRPLDASTRAFVEPRFGHDFSRVQVHADDKAAASARAVNALAYTVGRDIVFGAGQYAPHSSHGKGLIAHELAHVLQQEQSNPANKEGSLMRQTPDEEREPQMFGNRPPAPGDYVPDRSTIPIKEAGHQMVRSGSSEYTYDEWLTSQLGRSMDTTERQSFERGCVGLTMFRLGYPDKTWPWQIPGNECWLPESKALQRQKEMKSTCKGFPPAMYAFQSNEGWKAGKEPSASQQSGGESVDPANINMSSLWNFATRHKNAWEWMNHGKIYSGAGKPWRVRVGGSLPSNMGDDRPVTTLFCLACPKVPDKTSGSATGLPQPQPQQPRRR